MKKILFFVDRLGHGGIQTLLLNIVENIDRENYQVSFLCFDFKKEYELEAVFKNLNCDIHKVPHPQKNLFGCLKETKRFFKENKFDVLHCHSSSKAAIPLRYAKKYGVNIRIAHSHCTKFQSKNPFIKMIGKFLMVKTRKYANVYAACGKEAAIWMFGIKNVNKGNVSIINNAINLTKFQYDELLREELRKKYGIDNNCYVIGHIGRFAAQKNHKFLIQAFSDFIKKEPNSMLFLVGIGDLQDECRNFAKYLGVSEKIIFAGYIQDSYKYYSLFDVFVLPSLFEGLPLVGVEAQASGLRCIFSNTISTEVEIDKTACTFFDLSEGTNRLVDLLIKNKNIVLDRGNTSANLKKMGYDIKDEIKVIERLYER